MVAAIAFHPAGAASLLVPASAASDTPPAPSENSIPLERETNLDGRIAGRLSTIFSNVPSLVDVTVAVDSGVVSLGGTVPDRAAADRAETIAAGVEGVVTVENGIARDVSVDVGAQVGGLSDKLGQFVQMLPLAGLALVVALLITALGYLIASLSGLWHRIAPNSFLADLIASAVRFVFAIIGIVIALNMIGAGTLMGAVLGGAGVVGIALGFAMRDTIENYVASLMLSLRQPFRANDHVVIDSHEGRVIRLTSRATVLMTLDGNHLRIPNSAVFKAVILNYTRNPQRRFDFTLGVDADDDPEAAAALGRATLQALPFVLENPPGDVRIEEVGDSNVSLRFLAWIDQNEADWFKARSRAIAASKHALESAGFGLPEPIYRLRFDSRTGPLPLENMRGLSEGKLSESSPREQARAALAPRTETPLSDTKPQLEIEHMVNEERSGLTDEQDLLDGGRPVE